MQHEITWEEIGEIARREGRVPYTWWMEHVRCEAVDEWDFEDHAICGWCTVCNLPRVLCSKVYDHIGDRILTSDREIHDDKAEDDGI